MEQREMDKYGYGTASWIEMIWTLVTTVGMVVCIVLFREALGDYRWLRENRLNGERRLLALDAVVSEGIYVITLALFALIGIWSMFIPSPNPSGKPTTLAIMVTVVFVLVAISMMVNAFLRRYWRDEYIRRRLKRNRPGLAAPVTVVVDTTDIDSLEITTKAVDAEPDAP